MPSDQPVHPVTVSVEDAVRYASSLCGQGRASDAATVCRMVVALVPAERDATFLYAIAMLQQARRSEGVLLLRRVLRVDAGHAAAHYNLGLADTEAGRTGSSVSHYRRTLVLEPSRGDAWHRLANARAAQDGPGAATTYFRFGLAVAPDRSGLHRDAADASAALKRHAEAAKAYRRGLGLDPGDATALNNLGYALIQLRRADQTIDLARRAIHAGGLASAGYINLGAAHVQLHRAVAATSSLARALALAPTSAQAWLDLGAAKALDGRHDVAVACLRRALALDPDDRDVHSNLIFTLDYAPDTTIADHQAERRRWGRRHGGRVTHVPRPQASRGPASGKLRVGYVSPDFRHHSAAYIFSAVIWNHDRSRFEPILYSNLDPALEDDMTERFRDAAGLWRSVRGLSDEDLATRIVEDRIDILVDLAGHTEGHRLMVFARKPAPVQVTAWGHGTGTGLPEIDYFFADPVLVPASARPLFVEKVFDLPCFIPYAPPPRTPDVAPPPSSCGRPITFGGFNRLAKLSPPTIDLWSRLLHALPEARLLLKDRRLDAPEERERVLAAFHARGMRGPRIAFLGGTSQADHLAAYREIDVALDPFPQNGGISTYEALWMGVPVVALAGAALPGRSSVAILAAAGLADWAAPSPEAYLAVARRLAGSPDMLRDWRHRLRSHLKNSAVADPALYCRAAEDAYTTIWAAHRRETPSSATEAAATGGEVSRDRPG